MTTSNSDFKPIPLKEPKNDSEDKNGDENTTRGNWGTKFDFLLSCVGYAVGLGNIWRFPYLCYRNGGGAFLVPYILMLLVAGLPMFILELGFGQFASRGCIGVWTVSPLFKGLGYSMCFITAIVCIYYNVIISYTLFYLFASFTKTLPWSECNREWNTPNCTISMRGDNSTMIGNMTTAMMGNMSMVDMSNYTTRPSQEFWDNYVLDRSSGLEELGEVRWQLCLCLLLAWVIVFMCIVKGVKSSGKVVYVTATFPYLILFIFFIRGITLEGSLDGIIYYIKPDFSKLKDASIWKDAAVQIFYSLGIGWGSLQTMSSYNKFHNNFYRDAIIIACINCGTSIFAGFVIFSVIGFMSHDSGMPIDSVTDSGPGLAFVAYPEAIARMPFSPMWAVLFFAMLFTIGLDSQFVMMETVITALCDELQRVFPKVYKYKSWITLACCVTWFLLAIPMVTRGGIYLVTLMDNYSAGFSLLIVAFMESTVISHVYGVKKFDEDMRSILGFNIPMYWKICWMALSPLVISFIFVFFCATYAPLTYGDYTYTSGGEALGWLMILGGIISIPVFAVYYLVTATEGNVVERLRMSIQPESAWGPALNQHREEAGYPQLADEIDEKQRPIDAVPNAAAEEKRAMDENVV